MNRTFLVGPFLFALLSVASAAESAKFEPSAQADFVPADSKLELLWSEGEFTEGPAAAPDGTIYFSDIGNKILRFDPRAKKIDVVRDPSGRSNGLKFDPQGRLVACEGASGGGRRISVTEKDGTVRTLTDNYDKRKYNSPNDLAIAADGTIYFTDPRYGGDEPRELSMEGVFRVTPDGTARLATRDVQKPNGIIVVPDGKRVLVADNNPGGNRQLVEFRVQPDGSLADKKVLFDFVEGRGIDGMCLDVEGNIYATAGTGDRAGIHVFSPAGKPLAFVKTPGDPTNCVFGRGDGASTLYITAGLPSGTKGGKFGLYRIQLTKAGYHVPQKP